MNGFPYPRDGKQHSSSSRYQWHGPLLNCHRRSQARHVRARETTSMAAATKGRICRETILSVTAAFPLTQVWGSWFQLKLSRRRTNR